LLPLIQKFLTGEFGRDEKVSDPQQLVQQRPTQQQSQQQGTSLALNQVGFFVRILGVVFWEPLKFGVEFVIFLVECWVFVEWKLML
jgi:hypothetical protein